MDNILEIAKKLKDWAIAHRRHLHQYPELSLNEYQTSEYCQKVLTESGYKITKLWSTGFIADLDLGKSKRIAFRAEMDALPVEEENNAIFASKNKGISHSCGHDAHMAIALTTAKILVANKDKLTNNIRFVFQPSEEVLPGGALEMIAHGCLETVDEIYGLHNAPKTPSGTIRCLEGAITASCDTFKIKLVGKGGHASSPHTAQDPIYQAALMICEINMISAKMISPFNPAVIGITNINAGMVENIIPGEVIFGGVIRTFNKTDREIIKKSLSNIVNSKKILGYDSEIAFTESYPSIINEKYGFGRVVAAAESILGRNNVISHGNPEAWGEDFAYYLQKIPGAFFILGNGNEDSPPLHSNNFHLDEDIIIYGAAIMAKLAL